MCDKSESLTRSPPEWQCLEFVPGHRFHSPNKFQIAEDEVEDDEERNR